MNRAWPTALAAAIAASAVAARLHRDAKDRSRAVAVVLPAKEAERTAAASDYPIGDFWERARAAGVAGALFETETLNDLIARGEVFRFSGSESERWRIAGLIAPNSPLKGDSVWIRDSAVLSRVAESAGRQGAPSSTQAFSGAWMLTLPAPVDPAALPVGFDPPSVRAACGAGLIPTFRFGGPSDPPSAGSPTLRLQALDRRIYLPAPGQAPRFEGEDIWVALPRRWGARLDNPLEAPLERVLCAGEARLGDGPAAVSREVVGRGARLLVIHLSPELGVESNFGWLRAVSGRLRSSGFEPRLPPQPGAAARRAPWERWARYALAAILAALAPLVSVRQGLKLIRLSRCGPRWPQASPVPEVAGGLVAVMGAAVAFGLADYCLLAFPEWRLGLFRPPWALWATLVPLGLSAAALYAADASDWRKKLDGPVTYRAALKFIFAAAAALAVVNPPRAAGWPGLDGLESRLPQDLWWLRLRWREVLIGVPALVVGLSTQLRRLEAPGRSRDGGAEADPRPWLLAGLLGPIGVLRVFGSARAPVHALLAQTAVGVLVGAVLGGAIAAALSLLRPRSG